MNVSVCLFLLSVHVRLSSLDSHFASLDEVLLFIVSSFVVDLGSALTELDEDAPEDEATQYEEYTEDFDINPVAEVTVDNVPALCRALGVYNADSMLQALEAVLKGSDGTLAPVKSFLNDHHIAFTLKEYE